MAFLGQEEQIREFQDRFKYLYAVVFMSFAILTCRLVYLQVLMGDKMRKSSEENRIKRVRINAPRGMIFDRNRTLLIDNRPAFDLEIIPQFLKGYKQSHQVIALLAKLIKMRESEILAVLDKAKSQQAYIPVKIKTDLTRDEVALIESWKIDMPGVEVRQEIKRTNIYEEIASHLLGYIGEINATELPAIKKKGGRYQLGDRIGKFGLEQRLENFLRGLDGEEIKEVDAFGREKLAKGHGRVLGANPVREAIPGHNLILTIDQDLQVVADKAFGEKVGGVVAIDPRSGEILAMISRPSFDPTEFSRGISPSVWNKLLSNPNRPLTDKTIQDHYMPGSTFKILTAIAGLEEKVIDETTTFHCSGNLKVGNRTYHCWQKRGHGKLNVISGIAQSCDVFFWKLALKLKSVDDIAKWATHFGLGRKTGILLAREVPGLIPTEKWKQEKLNQVWNTGETLSVAIGQSFVLVTALQLVNAYAAFGNGGTIYKPFLVKSIESYEGKVFQEFRPEIIGKSEISEKTRQLIRQGLWGVVNSPQGTAYRQRMPGMDFAGKTGTVQTVRLSAEKLYEQKCHSWKFQDRYHALFAGFAPAQDPVIAVAVIGEHACHGSTAAAPIARAIIKKYLQKYFPELYENKVLAARLKTQGLSLYDPPDLKKAEEEPEDVSQEIQSGLTPKHDSDKTPGSPITSSVIPEDGKDQEDENTTVINLQNVKNKKAE